MDRRGASRGTAAPSWNHWGLRKGEAPPHPHLDAVVGGVGGADQVLVGPAIQVRVLPADEPITRIARLALALVHGVAEVAQVDALRMPVAVVALVPAGVLRLTQLREGRAG